jgi:amino acid transporter
VGWLCVLGWQTGVASTAYLASSQIQGLIVLNNPSYVPAPWHGTLLVMGIVLLATFFNVFLAHHLSMIEGIVFGLHILAFFAFIIVMAIYGRFSKPKDVFLNFQDNAGWGNIGTAMFVGQLGSIYALLGGDASTHMSEEVEHASKQIPSTITKTALSSVLLGFPMLAVFCFCLGDMETVLATPLGQPYIQVLYNATQSIPATTVLVCTVIVLGFFAEVNFEASASRQTFAFARDHGLPFSKWLCEVHEERKLPLNSILVSCATTILLSLINIGSPAAFNLVASLGVSAMLSSYLVCIICLLLKRYNREALLPRQFSLGRSGVWVNVVAALYLFVTLIFVFFPPRPSTTFKESNWSVFIFFAVLVFSVLFYKAKGRNDYSSPAEKVKASEENSLL